TRDASTPPTGAVRLSWAQRIRRCHTYSAAFVVAIAGTPQARGRATALTALRPTGHGRAPLALWLAPLSVPRQSPARSVLFHSAARGASCRARSSEGRPANLPLPRET